MEELRIPPKEAVARIRFDSDRKMLEDVLRDQDIQKRIKEITEEGETETSRRRLLASLVSMDTQVAQTMEPQEFYASVCSVAATADEMEKKLGTDLF